MSRLSQIRYTLYATKLTSSIKDYSSVDTNLIDRLLSSIRSWYEIILSKTSGERIDHRRSAQQWDIIYRQWVSNVPTVVLLLDINYNRSYHKPILTKINHIILYVINSCQQLGLECAIVYQDRWELKEYTVDTLDQSIIEINTVIKQYAIHPWVPPSLNVLIEQYHHNYYDQHAIILSDWYTRTDDDHQTQNALDQGQMIWYIRDYPTPVAKQKIKPKGLIRL